LPYGDDCFNLAFAACVVHHVPPPDWPGFVAEMRRVVRPGGAVCLIEHNPLNPLTRLAGAGLTEIESDHFLLFPRSGRMARAIEKRLAAWPLGAQYASSAKV